MKKRRMLSLALCLSLVLGLLPGVWAAEMKKLTVTEQDGKCGVVDEGGREILPPVYDWVCIEEGNTIHVSLEGQEGMLEGLYDGEGKELLPVIYDSIDDLSEGRRRVYLNGKAGYLDENCQVVIPLVYDYALWFEGGLAQVGREGLYGVIDKEGREVLPCIYNNVSVFEDGLISAGLYGDEGAAYGLFDREGKELLPMVYDGISGGYRDGGYHPILKWGETSAAYGLADREGRMVLPVVYQDIVMMEEDRWRVLQDEKYGVLDGSFQTLIPVVYEELYEAEGYEGYYAVSQKGKHGVLDREGKVKIPLEYDELNNVNAHGTCVVAKGGKKGLLTYPEGAAVTPLCYDEAYLYYSEVILVEQGGRVGALDPGTGAVLVPVEFDAISQWGYGYTGPDDVIITRKGELFGAYDKTGKELFPCQFGTLERLSGALRNGEADPAAVEGSSQAAGVQVDWYPEADRITRIYGSDRMALVKNGRFALYGLDGTQYTGYDFDAIGEQRAPGEIMAARDGKWGIIDAFGTPRTDYFWETQEEARDGVEAKFVSRWADGSAPYALVDMDGNRLSEYKYCSYASFRQGLAAVSDGKAYGFVNALGQEVVPCKYDIVEPFQEDGFSIVYTYDGRRYNAVDTTGRELWKEEAGYAKIWRAGCGLWGRGYEHGAVTFWNEQGEPAFPGQYRYYADPKGGMRGNRFDKNGVAEVYLENWEVVYIDTAGNRVEGPVDWSGEEDDFHEGLIWARRDGLGLPGEWEMEKGWGFKDEAGNLVVPYLYDAVGYFDRGYASVRLDGVYGILKNPVTAAEDQKALAELDILWLDGAEGELIPLGSDQLVTDYVIRGYGRWHSPYGDHGLWSVEGEHLLTADEAGAVDAYPRGPSGARIYAMSAEKIDSGDWEDTRYVDILGRTYLESELWDWDAPWNPPELDCSRAVNPDTNRIEDGKYFYADPWTGEIVLPAIYDEATSFSNGVGIVAIGGDRFAIDRTGARLFDLNQYDELTLSWFEGGRLQVKDKETGKQGYLDKTGKPIGEGLVWDDAGGFHMGSAGVSQNGRWGVIDLEGNQLIPCVFDDISGFTNGIATVTLDGRQGVLRDPRYKDKVSDWAAAEVAAAAEAGYVTGSCEEYQTFTITRRQFAELAVNYLEKTTGETIVPAPADTFTDTNDETVLKAYAAGIVQGVGDHKFSPGGLLTREQLAAMLWRAMEKAGAEAEEPADLAAYADGAEVSAWAGDSLAALVGLEVMAGTGENELSPKDSCTVEQAILLVWRGRSVE